VIAHGWADDPTKGWIHWLAKELEAQGINAVAPQFPDAKRPDPKVWLAELSQVIGKSGEGSVLVGHSLGCLVVLKYLSDLDPTSRIAGIVLVGGMKDTNGWKPEGLYPIDYEKTISMASKRICIYSNDDDKVEPERTKELAKLLEAELVLDQNKGHFAGLHGCDQLPSALKAVQSCYTD
jgi:predicted alpha/beta hydrolase family esterase